VSVARWLKEQGLLKSDGPNAGDGLPALCHAGALLGGVSFALDLQPDEAVGPLCSTVGGSAKSLRVLDVRDEPRREMEVSVGAKVVRWPLQDIPALVDSVNELFRKDSTALAVVALGEWEQMRQLWCVPKSLLSSLLEQPFVRAENEDALRRLARNPKG
jgi:hypothetical protein